MVEAITEKVSSIANGGTKLSIVFIASECTPWSKTGGLGDVIRDLPEKLVKRGHRVMSVVPRYDQYEDAWDTSVVVPITVDNKIEEVRYFHSFKKGVDRVFIDHPFFLDKVQGKTGSKLYGLRTGVDYPDNPLRFALMCQAALQAPIKIPLGGAPYGENVLFACNDWHSSLSAVYLRALQDEGLYADAKLVFILHNIIYQGRFPWEFIDRINVSPKLYADLEFYSCFAPPPLDGVSDEPIISKAPMKMLNMLQSAFVHADRIFTVSPSFAEEIVSSEKKGVELDKVLRQRGVTGILNGMDGDKWDPEVDVLLPVNYGPEETDKKATVKAALQAACGLDVAPDSPLIAFVGRLDSQKGVDALLEALPYVLEELDAQVVLMGTGKDDMQEQLTALANTFPGKAKGITAVNEKLEHLMMGGADYVIMPSRFEPCGLVQLHALKMGAVCLVSGTGGLKDSVPPTAGYQFEEIPSPDYPGMKISKALLDKGASIIRSALTTALAEYGSEKFKSMQKEAMLLDTTWTEKVDSYEKAFIEIMSSASA